MSNGRARNSRSSTFSAVLLGGASALALGLAPAALAQDGPIAEVTVTGTRILGVAPVGSTVITVGREDVEKSGVSNTSDLLFKVPQVFSYNSEGRQGGPIFGGAAINTSYANSPDIRGLGAASTLSLVNNHRMPGMGPNIELFDSEAIPAIALQRVEVIADGASAIYGSDAMAGVINYIMREPFDGAEVAARVGSYDGSQNWRLSGIFGRTWDTGGFMIAAERGHRDNLPASARPNFYNDDFRAFGGASPPDQAYPGNVTIGTGAGATTYPIPASNANALTSAELGAPGRQYTSAWFGSDATPRADVDSVVFNLRQNIWDGVEFYADGVFSNRNFRINQPARSNTTLTVPNTNPYSPCNAANGPVAAGCAGTTTTTTVLYNYAAELPSLRYGHERVYNAVGGFKVDLPWEWKGDVYASVGASENRAHNLAINTARVTQVLAGNGTATGSSAAGIPAFNPYCGTPCNNGGTLAYIKAYNDNGHDFRRTMFSGSLNGPIPISLPGGDVRLAIGGDYWRDDFVNVNWRNDNVAGTPSYIPTPSPIRKVAAAYAELYLPIVGEANAMSFVKSLELTLAGRYESYSDVGTTSNPKVGFNWKPADDLKVHGSFGTSFRAPAIPNLNIQNTASLLVRTMSGSSITAPGYTGPAGTITLTAPVGGNPSLVPESARTYSLGADWTPDFIPGLELGATYYRIKYLNKVGTQAYDVGPAAGLNDPAYAPFVLKNPRFWSNSTVSVATFDAFLAALAAGTTPPAVAGLYSPYTEVGRARNVVGNAANPLLVAAIIDGRRNNTGEVKTDGVDLTAFYTRDMDWGVLRAGAVASWAWSWEFAPIVGGPSADLAGKFTGPLDFSGRAQLGADWGSFSTTAFVNYKSAYDIDRVYIPAAAAAQYLSVDSLVTVDLTISYRTGSDIGVPGLEDITLTFGVQNLFDTDPPLVLNNTSPAIMFDPANASALGREVSFRISKKL